MNFIWSTLSGRFKIFPISSFDSSNVSLTLTLPKLSTFFNNSNPVLFIIAVLYIIQGSSSLYNSLLFFIITFSFIGYLIIFFLQFLLKHHLI